MMQSSLMQMLLALGLVVVTIPVALRLLRRGWRAGHGRNPLVRVVGGTALGPRERVAVVEVGGRWLVVGVTGQSVNLLATLDAVPEPAAEPATEAAARHAGGARVEPTGPVEPASAGVAPTLAAPTIAAPLFARLLAQARQRGAA